MSKRQHWHLRLAFGVFGNTDGLQVGLSQAGYCVATGRLSGALHITIGDAFGLSNSDYDSPGQMAMWILQHQRGFNPFLHKVSFEVPFQVRTRRCGMLSAAGGAASM